MNLLAWILPGLAAYPNVHPLLVHFPIVLLPLALLSLLIGLRGRPHLIALGRLFTALGTLGMIVAALAGLQAQEFMAHGKGSLVATHRSFMLAGIALAFVLSLIALSPRTEAGGSARAALVVGLVFLNGIVVLGADRGALVSLELRSGSARGSPIGGIPALVAEPGGTGDADRGAILYDRLACDRCHGPDRDLEAPNIPPSLAHAGSKFRETWLVRYLKTPHRIRYVDEGRRPVVRMPDFRLTGEEAEDLASFLAARTDRERFPEDPVTDPPLTREEAEQGRTLLGQYACTGCHMLGGTGNEVGPVLDDVGARLRPAYVYAFLIDPRGVIPGTPMKDFALWDDEARRLTAYLMTLIAPPSPDSAAAVPAP